MPASASKLRLGARSFPLIVACLAVGACTGEGSEPEWMPGPGTSSTNGNEQAASTTGMPDSTPGSTGGDTGTTTTGSTGSTTGTTTGQPATTTGMMVPDATDDMDGGVLSDASDTDAGETPDASEADGEVEAGSDTDGGLPGDGGTMTDADAESPDGATLSDADVDATQEDAGEEEPAWSTRDDLGEGDGSDVVTIGDSWMSNSLGTGNAIEGALDRAGTDYRHYGAQGVKLLEGSLLFGAAIPTQFDRAVRGDSDIKTVLMTGGGNDVIQDSAVEDSCAEGGDLCAQKLAEIADALEELWADMAAAGVQDVVYVAYASDAGSAGDSANTSGSGVLERCQAAPLNCHIIDSTPLVNGDLLVDGIHPTRAANGRMAEAILEFMEERKMRR